MADLPHAPMDDALPPVVNETWQLTFSAWPLVLVVLLVAAVAVLAWVWTRQLRLQAGRRGRLLAAIRMFVLCSFVFLLSGPSCTYHGERHENPLVAVLLDDSLSMSVVDQHVSAQRRMDLALASGMIDADAMSLHGRRLLFHLGDDLLDQFDHIQANAQQHPAPESYQTWRQLAELCQHQAEALAASNAPELAAQCRELATLIYGFLKHREANEQNQRLREVLQQTRQLRHDLRAVLGAQDASRMPLLLAEDQGRKLNERSRFVHGQAIVDHSIVKQLQQKANVHVYGLHQGLINLDSLNKVTLEAGGTHTDLDGPLRQLLDSPVQGRLAAVLMVTDGRLTAGGDPTEILQTYAAAGISTATLRLGEDRQPDDAVVADLVGTTEVYTGELINVDVRFRITGLSDRQWSLVVRNDGKLIDARTVQGHGVWQVERFSFPAERAGIMHIDVALQSNEESVQVDATLKRGITRERFQDIKGFLLSDLTGSGNFKRGPDSVDILEDLQTEQTFQQDYGQRLRGYLIPPMDGVYQFAIAGDDQCELYLSSSVSPSEKRSIAMVPGYTGRDQFGKYERQRSAPIQLKAGQAYYIEVLHKQGGGADHVSVSWRLPDGLEQRPISGSHLLPIDTALERLDASITAVAQAERRQEARIDNNHAQLSVVVSDDPIRVLLLDASPRWDSRYIMTLLDRDRRVQLTRRFRNIASDGPGDAFFPSTQAEWNSYDVVVLGDFRSDELLPAQQRYLRQFVGDRGGFLIIQAGPRAMPHAYSFGGLAQLLPVSRQAGARPVLTRRDQELRVQASTPHPITSILGDDVLNKRMWPKLPPLRWSARGWAAKPGSEVLLRAVDGETPIVAVQRLGAGKVCYVGTDETWRWRAHLGEQVHQTFWLQMLRWGLGDRLRGSDPRLQVALDRTQMAPTQQAELRVRAVDHQGDSLPLAPQVRLQLLDAQGDIQSGSERRLDLRADPTSAGLWHQMVAGLSSGQWRIRIESAMPDGRTVVQDRYISVVPASTDELRDLSADVDLLRHLDSQGRSRALEAGELGFWVNAVKQDLQVTKQAAVRTVSIWNTPWVLLLVAGLLVLEWMLRQRWELS